MKTLTLNELREKYCVSCQQIATCEIKDVTRCNQAMNRFLTETEEKPVKTKKKAQKKVVKDDYYDKEKWVFGI